MKKMIYIAKAYSEYQSDDIAVSYSVDEAVAAAKSNRFDGMSAYDCKSCNHSVEGYLIDVKNEETAEQAYHEFLNSDEFDGLPDPAECVAI